MSDRYADRRAGRQSTRLATYRRKRRFKETPEPATTPRQTAGRNATGRRFVVQLHHARRRHFDFRLQVGGVLRSWAVPKGPSRDPSMKHLAVEVEDHPLGYGSFERSIPAGHYGAGTVAIRNQGTLSTEGSAAGQIDAGRLRFELHGARLRGRWSLVRTRIIQAGKPQWLLIKGNDNFVVAGDVADDTPLSDWKQQHGDPLAKRRAAPPHRGRITRSTAIPVVPPTRPRGAERQPMPGHPPVDLGPALRVDPARAHRRSAQVLTEDYREITQLIDALCETIHQNDARA